MSEAARALVERTTTTQGIPQHVDDRAVLAKVAAILMATGNGNADPSKVGATTISMTTTSTPEGGRRGHST